MGWVWRAGIHGLWGSSSSSYLTENSSGEQALTWGGAMGWIWCWDPWGWRRLTWSTWKSRPTHFSREVEISRCLNAHICGWLWDRFPGGWPKCFAFSCIGYDELEPKLSVCLWAPSLREDKNDEEDVYLQLFLFDLYSVCVWVLCMHLFMCMNVCLWSKCALARMSWSVACCLCVYVSLKSVHMSIYGCVYCKRMRLYFLCVCVKWCVHNMCI